MTETSIPHPETYLISAPLPAPPGRRTLDSENPEAHNPVAADVEAALRALEGKLSEFDQELALELIATAGIRDQRIYAHLVERVGQNPVHGAYCLAVYGDPRGLEPIRDALWRFGPSNESPFAPLHLGLMIEAHEHLGGPLPPDLAHFVEDTRFGWAAAGLYPHVDECKTPAPTEPGRAGRNAPCPCGSGRKHKKCCLV